LDKKHIEKLTSENKKLRTDNIKIEVSKMALIRQVEREKTINKKLETKIRETKNMNFEEILNEL
jgi:hypothetical protein